MEDIVLKGTVARPFEVYKLVPIILVILAIITIIIAIRKHYIKGIVISIIAFVISYMTYDIAESMLNYVGALADGSSNNDNVIIETILIITSIIIQLIPFIICLKNNKKIKKDEVKQ